MAIAFDVATVATAYTATGTQTTSHAGSASARAAVVLIDQNASAADQVSGVTYGGTAMTRLGFDTEATEAGGVYIYWLDGVTGGTQNVAMTTTGTANKQLVVATMTVTAGQGIAVAGENTGTSASGANPAWSITGLTTGTKLECFEVIHSGLTAMTTTPAASWTLISSTDLGQQGRGFARQSVASSGTTCACGWTASTADDFVGSSVSFKEVAGAKQGSGAGTSTLTGSATGTRTPKGSAVGTSTFTGSATGTRTPKGATSGTSTFAGAASGTRVSSGSGSGSIAFTGTAAGTRTPKGSGVGTATWTGAAVGQRAPKGLATGATTWAGSATGSAPAISGASGSGAGDTLWTGTATGAAIHNGTATGLNTWTGTATGSAPAAGTASGSASGGTLWTGIATGATTHAGAAVGRTTWTGTATGPACATLLILDPRLVLTPPAHLIVIAVPDTRVELNP